MASKEYNEKKYELIAYLIIGVLSIIALGFISYFDLQSPESVSPIVYGGLTGAILRVVVKGFNLLSYLGIEVKSKGSDKEK